MTGVCGISVDGNEVMLAVQNRSFSLEGFANTLPLDYEDEFHGSMAMSRSFAAVAQEALPNVWIFGSS